MNTGEVLAETSLTGSVQREYIYFNGIAMARLDSNPGSPFYRFTDHLGSLRLLTDSTGAIKQELDYYPFGQEISVVSTPGVDDDYRFISRERDAESSNDHYWFRQYSPRLGRWCSADPLGGSISVPQSLNRYAYVANNPTNFIDPLGLTLCWGYYTFVCYHSGGKTECWDTGFICIQPLLGGAEPGAGGGGPGGPSSGRPPGLPPLPIPCPCELASLARFASDKVSCEKQALWAAGKEAGQEAGQRALEKASKLARRILGAVPSWVNWAWTAVSVAEITFDFAKCLEEAGIRHQERMDKCSYVPGCTPKPRR